MADDTTKKRRDWGGELEKMIREAIKKAPELRLQKRDPGVAAGRHVGGGMVVGRSRGAGGLDFEGDIEGEPWPCPVLLEAKAVKGRRLSTHNFQPGQLERLHLGHALGRLTCVLVGQHDDAGWVGAWLVEGWALPNPKKLSQPISVVIGGNAAWHPLCGLGKKMPAPIPPAFATGSPHDPPMALQEVLARLRDRRID